MVFFNSYYKKLKRLIIFKIIFLLLILSRDMVKYSNNTNNCLSIFYKKIIQISSISRTFSNLRIVGFNPNVIPFLHIFV